MSAKNSAEKRKIIINRIDKHKIKNKIIKQ